MATVLCVVGPTATGKTKMGVALAKRFNGEVVSGAVSGRFDPGHGLCRRVAGHGDTAGIAAPRPNRGR